MVRNNLTNVNYSPGRSIYKNGLLIPVTIGGIVIHTEQGYENGTVTWFHNPDSNVSSNWGVALDGTIDRIVDESNTAWANGNFESNSRNISIELEDNRDPDGVTRTQEQYDSVAKLIADASRRYGFSINRETVKGHNEVYPYSHPECPGNVDLDNVVARANEILRVINAPVDPSFSQSVTEYHELHTQVKIVNQVLNVRVSPSLSAQGSQANTPDGFLHAGMVGTVVGWGIGDDPYSDGRNKWYKSFRGKWFWAGGTSEPNPTVAEPVSVPVVEPIAPIDPIPVIEPIKPIDPITPIEPIAVTPVPEVTPIAETPAPIVEPIAPATPTFSSTFEKFEGPTKVIAVDGSEIVDINTGEAVAVYPANKPLTVIGYEERNGVKYLQTENLALNMQTHGLPSGDFEIYSPKGKLDGIYTAPSSSIKAVPVPTLEETLRKTNNKFVRGLLHIFHHAHK